MDRLYNIKGTDKQIRVEVNSLLDANIFYELNKLKMPGAVVEAVPERTCTKCKTTYPATTVYFNKHKRGKYGLNPICKSCMHPEKKYSRLMGWRENKIKPLFCACCRCKRLHPATSEYFYITEGIINGKLQCKQCKQEYYKKNIKKRVQEIHPGYIAELLRIKVEDLTPELYEQKKLSLSIKRAIQ